ncbi:MAG: DUF4347 domain-containing protein, partial [Candidatus Thiodiazotropha sp. (ex Troendleina suluensis)]|nr:DUF4347 domain-containing protein [Candidatus Thiodiazotropha sp. (ex Troendleina suluensis)]
MNRSKKRNPLIFEELEPRLLLSADLVGIAIDLTPNDADHQPDESDLQVIEQALQSEQALVEVTDPDVTSQELVIIDQTTPEYQSLVDDLISQSGDGRSFEIVLLDTDSNGIEQISETLSQYTGLDAVHLISHGSQGEIQLGSTTIDLDEVQHNGKAINAWGNAFSTEGDLLIYGCDLAATIEGERLVDSLAQLTGADVAASDDLTGHNTLGGDWDLEYQSGAIEVTTFANEFTQQSWQGLLSLIPTGSETLVNQTTTGSQITHYDSGNQVASDAAGNFVVVWADDNSGDVYGRLYDAAGTAQGNEFRVNTYTTNTQFEAAVAMDDGGNFMVTWNSTNQDGSGYGVYAQRFDASGTTQGSEFLVNQTTTNNQGGASVAADGSGNFIVTWSSYTTANNSFDVYARQYNAAGNPLGGEFLVNTTISNHQQHSAVAADDSGNFVVVWESYSQDGSGWGTYAQRFDAAGVAQGSEFIINTTTANEQRTPEIAMAGNGEFVVAWESHSQDGSGWGIYARRFDAAGTAQSGEIQVNTTTADEQDLPGVAMDDSGNFIVTWESYDQDAAGTYGIYARQFNSAGAAVSGEVQISTTYASGQAWPSVTWSNNQAVFAWSGNGSGDSSGVFFRLAEATPHDNEAPSFGIGDGTVTTDTSALTEGGQSVIVQPDGKILVAGYSHNGTTMNFTLTRYNADGSLDTSFDGDGIVTTGITVNSTDIGESVALQADGKILVAGYSYNPASSTTEFALVRYNSDGSLDTTFDTDGIVTTLINTGSDIGNSVTVQADDKILVAGYSYNPASSTNEFALVRYNSDGSLDTTFDTDGIVTTLISTGSDIGNSVTVQADDKILVAGYSYGPASSTSEFTLIRYNTDGSLDTTFDTDGIVITDIGTSSNDIGNSVTLQPDGKILVAGSSDSDFALVRYNSDGSLDATFDGNSGFGNGIVTTDIGTSSADTGYSVAVQADGKILVAGLSNNDFALARYNADGSLDTTFDGDSGTGNGKVTTDIGTLSNDIGYSVTLQPDGKILVAGSSDSDFALVRYNSDGSLDTRFDLTSTLDGTPGYTEGGVPVVLDANVQIFDQELTWVDNFADATLTLVRNGGASAEDSFSATGTLAALMPGGHLTVGTTTIGTVTTNSSGILLLTFNNNATNTLVNQAMQQITYANSSGAPPTSVQIDWIFDDGNTGSQGEGGALTATGSTTVSITAVNDAPTFDVGDGTVTTDISTGSDAGQSVIAQPDGKILVAGYSDNGASTQFTLTRYNVDGSLDTFFGTDGIVTTDIGASFDYGRSVTLQSDGKILVAGNNWNSTSSTYEFALVRYNTNGSLDTTFDGDGKVTTDISTVPVTGNDIAQSVTVDSNDNILVAGFSYNSTTSSFEFTLVRYDTDGSLDITFDGDSGSGNGIVTTDIGTSSSDGGYSVTTQSDGKILVAGSSDDDFALVRYNVDGSLDTTFDVDGKVTTVLGGIEDGYSVTVQSDGKILVAGSSDSDFALVRYNSDGSLDATFDGNSGFGNGIVTTDIGTSSADTGYSVAVQADGKILVAGSSDQDFALVRYHVDGSLDTTFDGDGKVTTDLGSSIDAGFSVTVQADGKILVAGKSNDDFALFRYNSDGSLDTRFDLTSTLDGTPSFIEGGAAVVLDADVQIFDAELSAVDDFEGATLTLVRNGGANAEDSYSATGTLSALTEGGNLTVGATTIGTVTTNSNGTLLLTFNSSATNARVNQAMQQIAYANSSSAPPVSVQIDWTCNDGNNGSQGAGGALNVVGSTTVTIVAVDDVPVANTDSISVAEGGTATTLVGGATDVLSNDTGLGDTPVTVSLVTGPTQSAGFTLNADGTFSYTHNGTENFTDSFIYRIIDNDGQTADATVNITITPVSDATPVAVVDTITVAEGATITTLVGGSGTVLNNDTGLGDTPVTVSLVTGPTQSAAFTLNADGTFSY